LLAGLTQGAHRRLTRANQITDRFMRLIWHPDRGQFTSAVQLGELFASRRSVLIRSPGLRGINDGATRAHSYPIALSWRWMP
jgi:hypothetical protein